MGLDVGLAALGRLYASGIAGRGCLSRLTLRRLEGRSLCAAAPRCRTGEILNRLVLPVLRGENSEDTSLAKVRLDPVSEIGVMSMELDDFVDFGLEGRENENRPNMSPGS